MLLVQQSVITCATDTLSTAYVDVLSLVFELGETISAIAGGRS